MKAREIFCPKCRQYVDSEDGICPRCKSPNTIDVSRYADPGEGDIPLKYRRKIKYAEAV